MSGPTIYFSCSTQGGRRGQLVNERILQMLQRYGDVLTDNMGRSEVTHTAEDEEGLFLQRDMTWLQYTDVVVAELSHPVFTVGFDVGRAVAMGKKVLCLFRVSSGQAVPILIQGAHNGRTMQFLLYEPEELEEILHDYFTVSLPTL